MSEDAPTFARAHLRGGTMAESPMTQPQQEAPVERVRLPILGACGCGSGCGCGCQSGAPCACGGSCG
ncbi:hypothetical protein EW053_23270 [Streptomyces sp. IB2014 016-6]|nr:hypothetical protein EW053_23270 [Streptomyces sp. IB2014 016-6]